MCLITSWRMPRITLHPIKCYKLLSVDISGKVFTPYQDYPVTFDTILRDRTKLTRLNQNPNAIEVEGGMFHCFSSLNDAKRQADVLSAYSWVSKRSIGYIVVRATIPLFTRYYRGTYRDTYGYTMDSVCAKRIKFSSNGIINV